MKVVFVIIMIGSIMPLVLAQASPTFDRSAEFTTHQRLPVVGEEAVATTSSTHAVEKGSALPSSRLLLFGKGGKSSKSGKSTKSNKSTSSDKESQTLFGKSGKSKSDKNNGVDTPHKLFPKSKKGNSAKADKSDGIGPLFQKAGKSKGSEGSVSHHQSDHLSPTIIAEGKYNVVDDDHKDNAVDSGTSNGAISVSSGIVGTTDGANEPPIRLSPTPQPTCKSDNAQEDFNLCIAIDGSGSVCNRGMQRNCMGCGFYCQDMGVNKDTCCRNFADIKEFSSLMVTSLEEFPVEKSFSVVQFGSEILVESELASADETLLALDEMMYPGGYTDHSSAIQACERTLSSTAYDDRKRFILLITDGVSTWPENDPEGNAEMAARLAKEDDISIIPIFISTGYDEDAHAFMKRLSSDGKVFDVTDFESLNSLQESLVNQVSCS